MTELVQNIPFDGVFDRPCLPHPSPKKKSKSLNILDTHGSFIWRPKDHYQVVVNFSEQMWTNNLHQVLINEVVWI